MTDRSLKEVYAGMGGGQTLPEYLRQLRKGRGYRQEYVASWLHVTKQAYSHYETGRVRPSAVTLYNLAKLYGISVEVLLEYAAGRHGCFKPEGGAASGREEAGLQMKIGNRPGK